MLIIVIIYNSCNCYNDCNNYNSCNFYNDCNNYNSCNCNNYCNNYNNNNIIKLNRLQSTLLSMLLIQLPLGIPSHLLLTIPSQLLISLPRFYIKQSMVSRVMSTSSL